jgi:hypothetical protein
MLEFAAGSDDEGGNSFRESTKQMTARGQGKSTNIILQISAGPAPPVNFGHSVACIGRANESKG